jgi:outer membrane receptor for ferrienterochelin and colicin
VVDAVKRAHISLAAALIFLPALQAEVRLEGRVYNENFIPLDAVRLTLSPKAAPNTRYSASSDKGGAFLVDVPAEGEYILQAERAGYFRIINKAVVVASPKQELQLTLTPLHEVFESVEVSATPGMVDAEKPASDQMVTNKELLEIPYPGTNNLKNALRIMPGMVQGSRGGIYLNGAAEEQTLYLLDGFNIADPLSGRLDSRVSIESIQTLEIATGAVTAEYGKGVAGVMSINTKTGDDRYRYSGTNFIPGLERHGGFRIDSWTPRFGFSGPIRRGKAWFSDSLDIQVANSVVPGLPQGQNENSSRRITNHLFNQVNLSPSNILSFGLLGSFYYAPRAGLTALDPRETTIDLRSRQWFFHVKDQVYFNRGSLVEFGYASNRTFQRIIPQGSLPYQITPDGKRGNYFADSAHDADRDQVIANWILPSMGKHQIKAGVDLDRVGYSQNVLRTEIESLHDDLSLARQVIFIGNGKLSRTNYETSSYIQDVWSVRPNLRFTLGLRSDWDSILSAGQASPRASFAWSPRGLENTRVSGGFAVMREATNLRLFTRSEDQYLLSTYFTPGQQASAASIFTRGPHFNAAIYRNWNVGIDQRLPGKLEARANFTRRSGRRGLSFENVWDAPVDPLQFQASTYDAVYNLGNYRRDYYSAVEFTVRQSLRRQYEWLASYTRSLAKSTSALDLGIDNPLIVDNNSGRTNWDTPNRFIGWGYLPLPLKNWAISNMVEWRSGFPFSAVNDEGRVVGPVNTYRYPQFFEMNLHLEWRFALRRNRWALRAGYNNITNHQNYNVVNNDIVSPQFMNFYGGQTRALNVRIRWLGKI